MKKLSTLLIICIFSLLTGCMKIDARYSYDNQVDFSTLKTFAWTPGLQESFSRKEYADLYRSTMEEQLLTKGFSLSSKDPDFLIRTLPSDKYSEVYITAYGNVEFHRGRVMIEILDAKTNEIIWEGVVRAYVSKEDNPAEVKDGIYKGVQKLLEGFPPATQK